LVRTGARNRATKIVYAVEIANADAAYATACARCGIRITRNVAGRKAIILVTHLQSHLNPVKGSVVENNNNSNNNNNEPWGRELDFAVHASVYGKV
jgi:hypothetical protein